MVGGAVAFDGQDVAAWLGRVLDGEVDPVAAGPVLGGQLQPAPQKGVTDVDLERVQRWLVQDLIAEVSPVRFDFGFQRRGKNVVARVTTAITRSAPNASGYHGLP